MPSRTRAHTAPNEREREILNHVVTAQRELEAALRLSSQARRHEDKNFQRKQAYSRMHRTLLDAANKLNSIRGTHHITDQPEWEPVKRPDKLPVGPPADVKTPAGSET